MSKISKKYFGSDQVDGEILKLEKNQAVRGHKQDGSEVEMFGLDLSDNPIVLGSRVALKSQVDDLEGVVQGNFDLQQSDIEGLRSDVDANSSAISTEQSRAEAAEQALDARLDTAESKITAIESDIADLESYDLELRSDIDDQESYSLDLRSDLDQEILDRQAGDESTLQSAQDYTDEQIAAIPPVDFSNYYNKQEIDASVDTIESSISFEASRAQQAEGQLAGRLDLAEPKISTLQNEMNAVEESVSFEASRAQQAEGQLAGRLDLAEPKISTLQNEMDSVEESVSFEVSRAQQAEGQLAGRLDLAEPKISTLQNEMDDVEESVSQEVSDRQAAITSVQGEIQTEKNRAEGAEQALDARIDALEAQVDGPSFGRFNSLVGATTSEFMLDRQVKGIMSCANGRVALHEGYDFTVSVDSTTGFTKLTFIGPSASGGMSEIESSDQIFVVYAY